MDEPLFFNLSCSQIFRVYDLINDDVQLVFLWTLFQDNDICKGNRGVWGLISRHD